MSEITVPWPPMPLAEPGWRQRIEALAERAEAMIGRRCYLTAQAELAVEWLGLAWPAISPEIVAGSCRASLLLGENVVLTPAPADQLIEVAERLDQIWEAAKNDPAAAVATVGPVLLNSAPTPPSRENYPQRSARTAPAPSDVPPGFASASEMGLELGVKATTVGAWAARNIAEEDMHRRGRNVWFRRSAFASYVPRSDREKAPRQEPPAGWFSTAEVMELAEISGSSVGRWRRSGRLGNEGADWVQCGAVFHYSPEAVERAIAEHQEHGALDDLLEEMREA